MKGKKKSRLLKIVFTVFLIAFVLSSAMAVYTLADSYTEQRTFITLAKSVGLDSDTLSALTPAGESSAESGDKSAPGIIIGEGVSAAAGGTQETSGSNEGISAALSTLQGINPDCVGWINIPGTSINYPVMKRAGDPEYYLHRDFYGSETNCGVPFLAGNCDIGSMSLVIYGHHMKNGSMFTDLTNFEDPAYRDAHSVINLYTPDLERQYEVIAVFREDFSGTEDEIFYYYAYGGDLTEGQFNAYIEGIRNAALYDTGFTASYGDKLIALSTCDYYTGDARFVVVGRKVS